MCVNSYGSRMVRVCWSSTVWVFRQCEGWSPMTPHPPSYQWQPASVCGERRQCGSWMTTSTPFCSTMLPPISCVPSTGEWTCRSVNLVWTKQKNDTFSHFESGLFSAYKVVSRISSLVFKLLLESHIYYQTSITESVVAIWNFRELGTFASRLHQIPSFHVIVSTDNVVFMETHAVCMEGRVLCAAFLSSANKIFKKETQYGAVGLDSVAHSNKLVNWWETLSHTWSACFHTTIHTRKRNETNLFKQYRSCCFTPRFDWLQLSHRPKQTPPIWQTHHDLF